MLVPSILHNFKLGQPASGVGISFNPEISEKSIIYNFYNFENEAGMNSI